MLTAVENWIKSIQNVESEMQNTVRESLQEPYIESKIVDDNVAQMDAGKDAGGHDISPPYAELTKQIKATKGQPTERVTLKDEGNFHSSVKVRFQNDKFELYADDWKTPKLGKKYGYQIFGLTDQHLYELRIEVYPEILERVKKQL